MARTTMKSRIPLPKTWFQRTMSRPVVYDFLLVAVAPLLGIAAALRAFAGSTRLDDVAGGMILMGTVIAFFIGACKCSVQWHLHEEEESTHDLEGCLWVLHTLIMLALSEEQLDAKTRVRFTIHVPTADGKKYVQALNYVGGESYHDSGGCGTSISSGAGIVGLVGKEKRCISANRETHSSREYLADLEKTWHFTPAEAKKRDMAAMAFLAVPIGDADRPDGILYGDSTIRGFFDDPAVLRLIPGTAVAVSKFLDLRY